MIEGGRGDVEYSTRRVLGTLIGLSCYFVRPSIGLPLHSHSR